MEKLRDNRTNSTTLQRCLLTRATNKSAATDPGRTKESNFMKIRPIFMAVVVAACALLPLSTYGLVGAQDNGSASSGAVKADAEDNEIQFNLVPASDAIANCFPDATAKVTVLLTEDEIGTDTFILSAKHLRPNTSFAVFLTELPVAPFGAVQYIADLTTNRNGKGSVTVNALIEEAFSSQVVNGQRFRKELNHVVFWFANPADANDCIGPSAPTPFDGDGEAGPAAMSSKNALPGAPLP